VRNKKKGFTLIELLITMLILSTVFGIVAGFIGFATSFYKDESNEVNRQESLRLFTVNFEKDIRKLVEHQTYFSSSELSGVKTIVLGDPSSPNKVTYVFNSGEGKIYRTVNGVSMTVASEIQNLNVTLDTSSNPFIFINITGMPDGRSSANVIEVTVYLRLLNVGG